MRKRPGSSAEARRQSLGLTRQPPLDCLETIGGAYVFTPAESAHVDEDDEVVVHSDQWLVTDATVDVEEVR